MKGFTKCANGHYYKEELPSCPYCYAGNKPADIPDSKKETQLYTEKKEGNKTRIILPEQPEKSNNRTVFGDEVRHKINGKEVIEKQYRSQRKLVGWLVTYSFDLLGADFRLYEGRNEIGRDTACNITVPDKTMSGKHATILFRDPDGFAIQDNGSTTGTFLNGKSLGFSNNWHLINDSDIIKMGETVFKFKTAI